MKSRIIITVAVVTAIVCALVSVASAIVTLLMVLSFDKYMPLY